MTTGQTRLSIRNVQKTFHSRHQDEAFIALTDVSLDVADGEFMVIVGPSGCGKSTLLDLLAGLSHPDKGEILLDNKPITGPSLDRGVVFQQYALFPWLTAQGNVEFGLEAKGIAAKERREIALHFLDLVGLGDFARHYPAELSGGMKQRVAIARSLAYDPEVLLMDEPFAALDAQTREILQCELLRSWERSRKTVGFITHGIDEAVFLGERVAVMSSRPGRIKHILTIPTGFKAGEDIRSHAEFGRLRHEIWSLLREEVSRAEEEEGKRRLALAA
ncbi:MAG: ABC transporter ATP-binding protein [Zoogloeaceae bacterium]|jgi:NitT/TauT family transport system ATP-binding protein|nr:ABC transporter ATP-binding protein [Zoogloeaceae bacterium]